MIELILNGISIDLSENQDFAISFSASKLQDIESRSGDYSTTFNIPMTSSVKTSLGHVNRLDSGSNLTNIQLPAIVKQNGITIFEGFGVINRITDTIELSIFSGNSNWIAAIGEKSLNDLDLSDLDLIMTSTNVAINRIKDYTNGFLFPNAYYGEFADPLQPFTLYDFFPAVFNYRTLKQIFTDIGWTIEGDLLSDSLFLSSVLPFSNDKIGTDDSVPLFDGVLDMPSSISGSTDNLYLGFNSATINFLNSIIVPSTTATTPGAAPLITIHDDGFYTLVGTINWTLASGTLTEANVVLEAINEGENVVLAANIPSGGGGFGDSNIFIKKGTYGLRLFVDVTSGVLNSISADVTCYTEVDQNFSYKQNVPFGYNIEMAKALPNITQTDFVKTIVNQFNVIIEANYLTRVVSFNLFENLKLNKPIALDWTNKIDLTQPIEIQFQDSNYAQTNNFKYSQDTGDIYISDQLAGDSSFPISNLNLDLETDLVQLPFSQSARSVIIPNELMCLPIRLGSITPRIAYVVQTSNNLITVVGHAAPIRSSELFFDDLKFSSLLRPYYSYLIQTLQHYRFLKARFKINTNDLINIDYTKPIFLDFTTDLNGQVRGYFYLNIIDQFNGNQTTITELIKLP
jgi:hypothetical protein